MAMVGVRRLRPRQLYRGLSLGYRPPQQQQTCRTLSVAVGLTTRLGRRPSNHDRICGRFGVGGLELGRLWRRLVVFGVMLMLGCRILNSGEKGELRWRGLRWLVSSSARNEKDGSGKE